MPSPPSANQQNPSIDSRYTRFRMSVRPSPIHRWGVYAGEHIPRGHKVIEYTGQRISRRETARRSGAPLNYLFTLDDYWTIDGNVGGSGAQYINHSCDPTCQARIVKGHILYFALRDIRPGEELTVDYRFDHNVPKVPCACGALACRGTINLKKEPRPPRKVTRGKKSKRAN
ncbi:MAG: SET domain-containing protein-lysine N-methyltransferase [Candidatus Solibacter usitatus]|nr:SET domain-containing protein-lysine N-methyltransferase [Candidatus Solibacter usitatus]